MGYEIKEIRFHSLSDNKIHKVSLPTEENKQKLKDTISNMNAFDLDREFSQNPNKCKMCIYTELCDYYKNDD